MGNKSKISIIGVLLMITFILSACTSNDMADYFAAIELASAEEMGKSTIDFNAELTFNQIGLTSEKLRELSYFDEIRFKMDDKYDESGDEFYLESQIYYNLGGLGFDMNLYIKNDKIYMKMPVQEKYLDLSSSMDTGASMEVSQEQQVFVDFFEVLIEEWKQILTIEDIIRGEKTYVLTDQGQIKATTYEIIIDEEQLSRLSTTLLTYIESTDLLTTALRTDGDNLTEADIKEAKLVLEKFLERMQIRQFECVAFVDFDGRMVKQTFDFELDFGETKPGELQTIAGSFITEKLELGKEQFFDFPQVLEDQWITDKDSNNYFKELFPVDVGN